MGSSRLLRRLAFVCLLGVSFRLCASDWHQALWLGRGDVWRARFPVTLTNPSAASLAGQPVALTVGDAPGQAPLAGVRAESVRVCDPNGIQLLYGLWASDQSTAITAGAIPTNATLVLPAVCAPNASTNLYVYFDNPRAWGLSDFFEKRACGELNGDFEKGEKNQPFGWQPGQTSVSHRLSWSTEKPFSGTRCLKAETDANAENSWFGFVRSDFALVPGAHCTVHVRVRGENVKGTAGWYIHVGDESNPQRINQVVKTGDGTFDWKEQTIAFTVPEGATRLQTGSVLFGTGTAWYDAFSFETDKEPPRVTALAGAVERLTLREEGADAGWIKAERKAPAWSSRLPVRLFNLRNEPLTNLLATVDISDAARGIVSPRFLLTLNGQPVETCRLADRLLFTGAPAARTALTYYLYVADSGAPAAPPKAVASARGSDIPSDQVLADHGSDVDAKAFASLLNSPVNLLKNPDFESGANEPEGWTHAGEGNGVTFSFGSPGAFGKRHVRMSVPPTAPSGWRGWHQSVAVKPGHSYLYGAWLACEGLEGSANLYVHLLRKMDGDAVPEGFLGAGVPIGGTTSWTPMFGAAIIPANASCLQMHLTMNDHGTLKHDSAFVAECLEAETGDPQTPPLKQKECVAWSVNPIVKVFRETLPPASLEPLAVSLARNEAEALQLALRAGRDLADVRIDVQPPKNARGVALTNLTVGWVGYVPIDHRTSYYNVTTPAWELKYPAGSGSSDGWSGWWPDPIRPVDHGALAANQTQPLWILFKTTAETPAGVYKGEIKLTAEKKTLKRLPFTVTVWDFALPQTPSCAAIYDLRLSEQWQYGKLSDEALRDQLMRFMADHKVCPDRIDVAPRFSRDAQGQLTCDFAEYDKAAQRFFDELKFPTSYMPWFFYAFGWEHPPSDFFGEKPYEGNYPYATVDRSQLRPAYKAAYQAYLRLYWEHVKAKGWADKLVLYISDEPFYTKKPIVDQMKALCDMIHEVDPKIRIYCSTWNHCPDWNGHLNIWGAGHYGCFPVSEMQARRAAGEHIWFTTDGQMCTDTPFCAVERLLPHYCFKYGADAYEFWGINWLTYDPWKFGWHSYIYQSSTPGESYYVRYPNGDGFLIYPGGPVGAAGPVSTVRIEAARDGVEDYEYLKMLKAFADQTGDREAVRILAEFAALLDIPNAGGRYSSKILPEPNKLTALRLQAGAAIERLSRKP